MHEQLIQECILRWKCEDENTKRFYDKFSDWVRSFPTEISQIILEFIIVYEYYSHSRINQYLHQFFLQIKDEVDLYNSETIFVPIKYRSDFNDSSSQLIIEFITRYNIDIRNFCTQKSQLLYRLDSAETILIIDDICGSGNSFLKFIEEFEGKLTDKKIYYFVVHSMAESKHLVLKSSVDRGLNVIFLSGQEFNKGFTYINDTSNLIALKDKWTNCSKELGISKDYIFGYCNSESLVSFYHDTPNNTFGVFWWNLVGKEMIFPPRQSRMFTMHLNQLSKGKKSRKLKNYRARSKSNGHD